MDETSKAPVTDDDEVKAPVTGHVYPANHKVFYGSEDEQTYRDRNALLVAALRSGQFTQATKTLQRLDTLPGKTVPVVVGQCCLGVACLVAQAEGMDIAPVNLRETNSSQWLIRDEDGSAARWSQETAPPVVYWWLGWGDGNPLLYDEIQQSEYGTYVPTPIVAASRNDGGEPFHYIADCFERTFVTFTREEGAPENTDNLPDYLD